MRLIISQGGIGKYPDISMLIKSTLQKSSRIQKCSNMKT